MGTAVSHGVKIILQRDEFDRLLGECDRSVSDVWQACVDKHGIGIQLKTFRTLVANREQWQALYAWALTDTLGVRIKDLFVMVDMRGSDTPRRMLAQ